jgi:hypothetical protein
VLLRGGPNITRVSEVGGLREGASNDEGGSETLVAVKNGDPNHAQAGADLIAVHYLLARVNIAGVFRTIGP